jgi:hypothetical protein
MKKLITLAAVAAIAAVAAGSAIAGGASPHSTGSVDWNYQGRVTGHVSFDANAKTGGSLDYQNSNGAWLHGVVDPSSYTQTGNNTVQFSGTISDGSATYMVPGAHFTAVVTDGGTSGNNGDQIAVFANEAPQADLFAVVTGGNLVVH